MKVFVASLMLVCTVGVGAIFADCGWIVWQIINKEEKNFWRVRDSVETYDGAGSRLRPWPHHFIREQRVMRTTFM